METSLAAAVNAPESSSTNLFGTITSASATSSLLPSNTLSEESISSLDPSYPAAVSTSIGSVGSCSSQASYGEGNITWYNDVGLGACGILIDQAVDLYVALPAQFFDNANVDANPNNNPLCGKSVTINNPAGGLTAYATVEDHCVAFLDIHIDLTVPLYNAVAGVPEATGVVTAIQRWFNN
jgi:hypothetical protein